MGKAIRTYISLLLTMGFVVLSPLAHAKQLSIVFAADMPLINAPDKGDYRNLGTLLDQQRKKPPTTFFLFGGGSVGPSPMSAFDKGAHIIDILNSLEPDAMGVTKREFSYFEDELTLRAYEAAFPIVTSNVYDPVTEGNIEGVSDHAIIEKSGIRLGVLSVIDKSVIEEYLLERIQVLSPLNAIKRKASELREQDVDAIVLLYSANFPFMEKLLDESIVDVAILADAQYSDSPTYSLPEHPRHVSLVESGKALIVTLNLDETSSEQLIEQSEKVPLTNYAQDNEINALVSGYTNRLDRLLNEEIGMATRNLDTRKRTVRSTETAFGNYLADAMREFFDSDIAMINGGVIRGDKQYDAPYSFTRRDAAVELPFRSRIVMLEMTGKQILDALENSVSQIDTLKGRFLHVSGMSVVYDTSKPKLKRIIHVEVGGKPLDEYQVYTVTVTDYLASGGDGFVSIGQARSVNTDLRIAPLLSDVLIRSIRRDKTFSPETEARLTDLGG